jgi:hypothetical protein
MVVAVIKTLPPRLPLRSCLITTLYGRRLFLWRAIPPFPAWPPGFQPSMASPPWVGVSECYCR